MVQITVKVLGSPVQGQRGEKWDFRRQGQRTQREGKEKEAGLKEELMRGSHLSLAASLSPPNTQLPRSGQGTEVDVDGGNFPRKRDIWG